MNNIFLYDTHVHTNSDPLLKDIENIVAICRNKHIAFNAIGTEVSDCLEGCKQAHTYNDICRAIIGIHPENAKDISDVDKIEQIYLENKDVVVAIGEIGLDYVASSVDKETQKKFFIKQIELANKYNLPICIHCREAEQDCLEILKLVKNPSKVWIHCFAKSWDIAKIYIDRGYMISIPGIVTFKNGKDVQEAVKHIPLDRLMVETDGPYLAPVPMRGKTNYPHYVQYVEEHIAHILDIDKNELAKQLTYNSLKFFGLVK